jgi:hypothetical protein
VQAGQDGAGGTRGSARACVRRATGSHLRKRITGPACATVVALEPEFEHECKQACMLASSGMACVRALQPNNDARIQFGSMTQSPT